MGTLAVGFLKLGSNLWGAAGSSAGPTALSCEEGSKRVTPFPSELGDRLEAGLARQRRLTARGGHEQQLNLHAQRLVLRLVAVEQGLVHLLVERLGRVQGEDELPANDGVIEQERVRTLVLDDA